MAKPKGAWIARRSFKIELTRLSSTFDFRSMTREEAEKFTGYPGALVYVDYNDGQLTEEQEDNQQVVTCYIAERVLRGMQSQAGSAKLLQSFLISEIVATVLSHAAIDIQSVKEVPEKSILARILKQLGDSDPMPLEALKKLVTDAVALRAAVHDRTQLVNNLKV